MGWGSGGGGLGSGGVGWRSALTYGQGHDLELVAHELYHHALLQRRGAAAQHRSAAARHRQELVLQAPVQRVGQRPPVDHQAQPVHQERPRARRGGRGGGGGGVGGRAGERGQVEGGELLLLLLLVSLGGAVLGRGAAQELGLDVVQALLQQDGTGLLRDEGQRSRRGERSEVIHCKKKKGLPGLTNSLWQADKPTVPKQALMHLQ